jgi:hypothetical protein
MKRKLFATIVVLCAAVILLSGLSAWVGAGKTVPVANADIQRSAAKGLLLLQQSGYNFINRTRFHCASCHHATLTSIAVELGARKGIPVIDSFARQRAIGMGLNLKYGWNPNTLNSFITAKYIGPYTLLGMNAEKLPPTPATDIAVDYMLDQARPDGSFQTEAFRVPLEAGEIHLAALSIRAIQLYASPAKKSRVEEVVARCRKWFENSQPEGQQELAFQLLGLQWTDGSATAKERVAAKLLSMQNADGGWSQLPGMKSDAYATGQSIYALFESGMNHPGDEACQKAISYLLKTQDESGAWIVETRSNPIQPFFTSDFPPYDENQYISAAASNWAVIALFDALPDKG